MATSRRVGNYATSAKAVTQASDQIFDAAMSSKPDFTKISKEAIKGRSLERRAATEAEGEVASAGLKAFTEVNASRMRADRDKKIADAKRPARRMAGMVGALGALTGAYVMSENDKKDKAAHDEYLKKFDERTKAMEGAYNKAGNTQLEEIPDAIPFTPPTLQDPTKPSSTKPSTGGGDSSTPTGSVSTSISAQSSFDPTKKMSKTQIKALAESVGFNPEAAGIVVGIAGGESGYDPTNSTQREIPGRKNLFQQTGEDSVGLMQINWGYHKGKGWLQNLGITKREDLFDPVKNMKAAKYLYDGRGGGFQDWTVYNKNIYKNYL